MRRILIASSKGGCGKTTVATNLAVRFAKAGLRTVILDGDRQMSSLEWSNERPATEWLKVVAAPIEASVLWSLKIPATTDVVIFDAPAGVHGPQLGNLIRRCDTLIVPVLPSRIDWRATRTYLEELQRLPEWRSRALRMGVLANRVRERNLATRELQENLERLGLPCLGTIRDTQAYVLAAAVGKSIFDFDTPTVRDHWGDWDGLMTWLGDAPRVAAAAPPAQLGVATC